MRKHLIIAGLILAFEACVGIGLIGMGCGMVLVVVFVILAIAERRRRSEWFRAVVIYALMFVATMALSLSNIRVAERRAAPVISAVSRYHSEHGHYPKTLDELVPTYLPSIPHAGFTLLVGTSVIPTMRGRNYTFPLCSTVCSRMISRRKLGEQTIRPDCCRKSQLHK